MSALTMNGTSMMSTPSLSAEDSEESFVVLGSSMTPETPEQTLTMNSSITTSAITCPSIPQIPQNEIPSTANAMSMSTASELSPDEIQTRLESLLQENLQLKETLHQNNLAMKKQFNTLVMWQEDVMKVHQSHKEKFEETKKLITNLRAENAELKKAVSLPIPGCSTPYEEEHINLKSKISALEFELDTLRQGNIKYKNDQSRFVRELEEKLSEAEKNKQEESIKLNEQIQCLKTQLKAVEEHLVVAQKKVAELSAKVPTVSHLETIENLNRQVKELSTEVLLKNKVLKEKTDLTDALQEEISKLKIDNESIPILKTQVDVYQADFTQEREARNTLKEERDRIAEDLRHLQRRNQQLLEEVERLREMNFVHVSIPPRQQQPQQSPSRETSPPSTTYQCPICQNNFRTLRILEDHIEHCIQNSS